MTFTATTPMSRRRSMLLGGGAVTALVVGQASARPYVPMLGKGVQGQWRFCNKCFSMFFAGATGNGGVCSAGGAHQGQGWEFQLAYDSDSGQPTPGRDSQYGWRYCEKCFVMFYAGQGGVSNGACPVVSNDTAPNQKAHFARGVFFGLPHDNPANPGQGDWRACSKCWGLFFDDPKNPSKGHCPGGGAHTRAANSFNFQLPHNANWVNVPPPPPPPPGRANGVGKDPDTASFDSGFIRSRLPVDAWAHLTIRRNGDFTFATHAHDSGAGDIDYTLSAVLVSTAGIVFTFQHSGRLGGLVGGSRNSDFTTPAAHSKILAREFDGIAHGAVYKVRLDATDTLTQGLADTLSGLAKDALKDLGKAATDAVVALVTA